LIILARVINCWKIFGVDFDMTGLDNKWLTQITLIMMLTFCDLFVAFTSRMSLVVENRREVCAETYKR
jgi:oligoribonuclease (3'-5' exoribonuclease)